MAATAGPRRTWISRRVVWGVLLLIVVGIVAFLPVLYVLVERLTGKKGGDTPAPAVAHDGGHQ
jgi:hypothetical protein